ncbi:MAG: helix-turn-helix transcriptional regulator [Kiritimatiellae bacterium]|nr:helix-turn-helix transcriptional regulator [Kiritimatiellia bacterium]
MFAFAVHHSAAYSDQMCLTYTVPFHVLSLVVSGLDLFHYPGRVVERAGPIIFLVPKGTRITLHFSRARLNYGIVLNSGDIRLGRAPGTAEVRNDGDWRPMPIAKAVAPKQVDEWRQKFDQTVDAYLNPSPARALRAEMNVVAAVLWLLEGDATPTARTPAARLKALIDADLIGRESLEDLCGRCRYSSDHLRTLFEKEFGISPKAYRDRCRISRAMELIGSGSLSLKEIAAGLGYANASHFSSAFRRTIGISPHRVFKSYRLPADPA